MREQPRVLIVAIVLLGHAAAIYLLMVRVEIQRNYRGVEFSSFPIQLTPLLTPESMVQPEVRAVDTALAIVLPEPNQESTAITMPSVEPKSESGNRIDWAAQAEQMARKWSETNSRPGNFGAADQGDEPADDPARNIFEGNSPRRAGYVEMIAPGVERRWINSRCYREFGQQADPVLGTRPDLNPINCLMGSGSVRDDLFDHLKPDYLKDQE